MNGDKLIIYKALIRIIFIYTCPGWEFRGGQLRFKISATTKRSPPHQW